MCRLLGGLGKARYLNEFMRIAFRDSKGRSHPDGWGFAVHANDLMIFKSIYPIWERPKKVPKGNAFLVHARRGERLKASLEHVQPHVCEGVVLVHNGGARVPMSYLESYNLAFRSSSERLACLLGSLLKRVEVEKALEVLAKVAKPSPAINLIALVPSQRTMIVLNYHTGDSYYVMWRKGDVFSSEPLGEGWEPMSESGKPVFEVLHY